MLCRAPATSTVALDAFVKATRRMALPPADPAASIVS
jgi:hypothetical protein